MDPFYYLCFLFVMLFLSVHCSLGVTCCERAGLLALLCVMFFVTFQCGVVGQLWYLIASIPDPCLLLTLVFLYFWGGVNCFWCGIRVPKLSCVHFIS